MRMKYFRTLFAAALLAVVAAACTDLTVAPKSSVTGDNIFKDPNSYKSFLAKIYGGLAITGQDGPHGRADIGGIDEGFSQYMRLYWQLQSLPTDEAGLAWGDAGVDELNTQIWGSTNQYLVAMYYRVFFQVAMANEFLRETTDDKLNERGVTGQLRADIQEYRAEARFLRALSYFHGVDLFGNIPLVDETFVIGANPPPQATREEVYTFVVSELQDVVNQLPVNQQYGRASRGAANMLLAKLYMNSAVYTGTSRYTEARTALEAVIGGPYSLDDDYTHMFLADNHTSPELIFTIPQDGLRTQSWGGTTFLVHASVGGNMNTADFGIDFGWWGLRAKQEAVARFETDIDGNFVDGRGDLFFTDGQNLIMANMFNFFDGYALAKYKNVTSTGAPGSHVTFPDTDFPMFRLADAYLMYAEAVLRGGGGDATTALGYVNAIRQRAYGDNSGDITAPQLTLDFVLDERLRELIWEGHRRQDLIRFDQFTTNGVWAWKGGDAAGRTTSAFRNLYPLPASELLANPNLTQNPGY